MTASPRVRDLVERVVRATFDANPGQARSCGDHAYDGRLSDVGRAALERREAELEAQSAELRRTAALESDGLDSEQAADLATAQRVVEDELFHLRVLRDPATDPQWAIWRGCDVSGYVIRPYAPAADRAGALIEHLEQLPQWLEAAAGLLDAELAAGPRDIAVESLRGHATFYRDEVRQLLGPLDAGTAARLDRAVEPAAAAVEAHATRLEAAPLRSDWALGPDRFIAMLGSQEGVAESTQRLRARVDEEMDVLTARGEEVAGRLGQPSLAAAFDAMERDHPGRQQVLQTAADMLDDLHGFWADRGVLTVAADVECTVRRSPTFYSFITAAFEPPGFLDPPGLPNYYYVTPIDPSWTDEQAEQWLRHLNRACLLNISVHEVYPGHFVHSVNSHRNPSLVRNCFWFSGFGEGWAHYTELLAVEQGLAEAHPWLELAMVQDGLLRCGRFSATVGMHAEGRSLRWATDMMERSAHIPRLAAEREALRGTWDPMYLVYTYGKLEILRWRTELQRRPGFSLRRFHDRMIGAGSPPLSVMQDYVVGAAAEWLGD